MQYKQVITALKKAEAELAKDPSPANQATVDQLRTLFVEKKAIEIAKKVAAKARQEPRTESTKQIKAAKAKVNLEKARRDASEAAEKANLLLQEHDSLVSDHHTTYGQRKVSLDKFQKQRYVCARSL